MPARILMPALSPTMTEGTLAKWLKKEGDPVAGGDVIAEIETDKATMEVEAVDEGVLAKIMVAAGTEHVAVNTLIAVVLEEGEDASALEGVAAEAQKNTPAAEVKAEAEAQKNTRSSSEAAAQKNTRSSSEAIAQNKTPAPVKKSGSRIIASPLAKRIARDAGLDLAGVQGSGPHGRIIKRDVESATRSGVQGGGAAAVQTGPMAAPPHEAAPNSNMRKIIAARLTESARDIPHFNMQMDVEIDALLALRKSLNDIEGAEHKFSVNDFVVKGAALALMRCPDCNVSYTDEAILRFGRVDISMAVAVEGGLVTPIIFDAANKGLAAVSAEAKALAAKARDGKLTPEEFQGGTFTISNLGMFGVGAFNSIINPPQGAILSVGAGLERPVARGGVIEAATVMTLTLAVDHRCIDGAAGAAFMQALKGVLENPLQILL